MTLFANSLAGNTKVKELLVAINDFFPSSWASFTGVVCNKLSIVATYESNHTLKKVTAIEDDTPDDLEAVLQLN